MKYFSRVFPYLRPYWRLAVIVVGLIFCAAFVSLIQPWPLKFLVDYVLGDEPWPPVMQQLLDPNKPTQLLIVVVVVSITVALLNNIVTVLSEYANTRLDQQMVLDFRADLFQHAQRLSLRYHDQAQMGKMMYAINFMGAAVAGLILAIPTFVQSLLILVGMFLIIFSMDPILAFLSLSVVPFLFYSIHYYANHIQSRLMHVKDMEAQSLSIVHDAMSMIRVMFAFTREPFEFSRFRKQAKRAIDARVDVTVRQAVFSLAVNMTTAIGTAVVLGYGAYKVQQGQITVGDLLVVLAYLAAVYKPLETIAHLIGALQDQIVSLQIAFSILDANIDIKDEPGAVEIETCHGNLTFENVSFSYLGREGTLQNISVEIKAGQTVAVVGPTGAGKTTLASLLPRFYDVDQGRILLDGQDIRGIKIRSLREQVSLVLQEPLLFSGTIAENIRYGRLTATDEELIAAAEAANAHEFITKLPDGYETQLGERGVRLSGGERQRICIARAFLKDAPILILDEPTSAVDSRTESVILDALDGLMAGRTSIMIAHRLSTIHHADIILVVENGKIVEQGNHHTLLERNGLYHGLYTMQNSRTRRNRNQLA